MQDLHLWRCLLQTALDASEVNTRLLRTALLEVDKARELCAIEDPGRPVDFEDAAAKAQLLRQ